MPKKITRPIISYCIPVMNRLYDIQDTLGYNIEIIKKFQGCVDIHIVNFDEKDDCEIWVHSNFKDEIRSGFLKFHRKPPLPYWHFSWAKNSFIELIDSMYYSSLDGDNILTVKEVRETIRIISSEKEYVMHHFSGDWGDGTSGRVTVPTVYYKKYGYINDIFPRQFDEIGLIFSIIVNEPQVCFVARPNANIFDISNLSKKFLEKNNIELKIQYDAIGSDIKPLRPKGGDYIEKEFKLYAYHNINMYYTLASLSKEGKAKSYFTDELRKKQFMLSHEDRLPELISALFSGLALDHLQKSNEKTLYAVIRDDREFLVHWYSHYKSIGVTRFIIVDDGSREAVESVLPYNDVYVVKPMVGTFKYFKVFWLSALMKAYQEYGSWVLTVDSDEFLDLPDIDGVRSLSHLVQELDGRSLSKAQGLLFDMMPDDAEGDINERNFIDRMTYIYNRPINMSYKYQDIPSIKWAFGKYWWVSFCFDLRWRIFNTIDCLRKFPIVKYDRGVNLHQGYHAVYVDGREVSDIGNISNCKFILPMRHYKMYKIVSKEFDRLKEMEKTSSYFSRTEGNLKKMYRNKADEIFKFWKITPFKRRYDVSILRSNLSQWDGSTDE